MPRHRERVDPVERTAAYKRVVAEVDARVEAELAPEFGGQLGYCHVFWARKQELLRAEYHIEWKTPAEMNPMTLYD
jgi:hypothetical protein